MLSFKQAAIKVLKESNKPLSYREITFIAIDKELINTNWKTPEATMNSYITQDIKDYWDNSFFNRTNKWHYQINPQCDRDEEQLDKDKTKEEIKLDKKEERNTQFTGKWWEYLVCSKLLFNGYYACLMSVDDWIDIVAIKNKRQFLIQVKTSNTNKNWKFNYSINKKSFNKYLDDNPYFIFVVHADEDKCFIISSQRLLEYFKLKKQTDKNYYNIQITKEDDTYKIEWNEILADQRNIIK